MKTPNVMKLWTAALAAVSLASLPASRGHAASSGLKAFGGGPFITLDPAAGDVTKVLVSNGRILPITDDGSTTPERVELGSGFVLPGFVDSHIHLASLGAALDELDLSTAKDEDDVAAKVAARVKTLPKDAWMVGGGWNQNDWPSKEFPTHAKLDAVTPDNPAMLDRIDGHAVLVNAKVMALAGITAKTKDPDGGKILRDAKGAPTGVFVDNAIDLVAGKMPKTTPAQIEANLLRGQQWCFEHGITGVHDAGISQPTIDAYRRLENAGKLKLHVYAMLFAGDEKSVHEIISNPPPKDLPHFRLRAVKIIADGALGSRGAHLLADYSDDKGNRGLATTKKSEIEKIARVATAHGWQVNVHAIGDAANRDVLDVFEKMGKPELRPRIEHAQIVSLADLPRFAKLGVIASMQPWHLVGDKPWAEARVGAERIKGGYAWKTLADSGAHLTFGSDAPAGGVSSPLQGIHAAVTREGDDGMPAGGWYPAQRLTRDQAIRGYTEWPAWASFDENDGGTISKGKRADFVVLSADPRKVPDDGILKIEVLQTIVDGETVWLKPQGAVLH